MLRSSFRAGLLAAPALAALSAGVAFAQEAQVDELIVTAQLREQRAVEVPFALTALGGADMEKLGVQDFEDLGAFVPGFDVQNQSPNNPGFVMRGITSDSGEASMEPRVSVFQDGVSISKSRGSYVELFDIERVEVAKGPQSTLYGRGALIGAVNIIQNKARPGVFSVEGEAQGGDNGYWLAQGAVNMPIADTAALRISARLKQRDGYVDNLSGGQAFNSVDTRAVRAAFNWTPSDRLRIDIIGNYQIDDAAGTSFKSGSYRPTNPLTGAVIGSTKAWDGVWLTNGSLLEGGKALGLDREVWGGTGVIRYDLSDSLRLTSTTAYRQFDSLEIFDADGVSLQALTAGENAHGKQTSQEFRLNWNPQARISGFLGVNFFHEKGYQRVPTQFDERVLLARLAGALNGGPLQPGRPASDPAPAAVFGQTAFTAALLQGVAGASGIALAPALAQGIAANLKPAHLETATNGSETDAIDIFGDLTFQATERLELGVGLRYSRDEKTASGSAQVLNGRSILGGFIGALGQPAATRTALLTALAVPGAANIPPSALYPLPLFGLGVQPTAGNGGVFDQDLKDDGFTWRATARYAVSDDASVYANYARGRRPRVLAGRPPSAPGGVPIFDALKAETVDSFEIGAKAERLADGRLSLEGALFHYAYRNFQTTEQVGTTFVTTNAGEAKAFGFEGQARFAATDFLDVFATYAYNHARFETGVRDGNRMRLSPDHSASFGADLHFPVLGGEMSIRPAYTWQSKVFFDDDNDLPALQQPPRALIADNIQDEFQKAYGLVNLRLDYRPANSNWAVGGFVTNLLNETYVKDAGNVGDSVGLATFIAGEPRFWGVTLSYRY